jgi:phospholipid transport system transporter-binding protein
MPSADPAPATLQRDGDTLRFGGDLVTTTIAVVWKQALAQLPGVRRFDLAGVDRVDSAGVALLAELAQRAGDIAIDGDPAGLSALRGAYRLTPALGYAS